MIGSGRMDESTTDKKPNEPKTYQIGDKRYRQEPLSWSQEKWLAEHVFGDRDVSTLDTVQIMEILQEKAPLLLGIVLIEEGWTRGAKGKAGVAAAKLLAEEIANEVTPEAIKEMAYDFFTVNPIANLWLLLDFGALASLAAAGQPANGLTPASASSPAEIFLSEHGSSVNTDQETVSSISDGSSSDSLPT